MFIDKNMMWYFCSLDKAVRVLFENPKQYLLSIFSGLIIGLFGEFSNLVPSPFNNLFERILQENVATFSCVFFCVICLISILCFWMASSFQGPIKKIRTIGNDLMPDCIKNMNYLYFSYSSVNIGICLSNLSFSIIKGEATRCYFNIFILLVGTWLLITIIYAFGYLLVPEPVIEDYRANGVAKIARIYSFNFFLCGLVGLCAVFIFLYCLALNTNTTQMKCRDSSHPYAVTEYLEDRNHNFPTLSTNVKSLK